MPLDPSDFSILQEIADERNALLNLYDMDWPTTKQLQKDRVRVLWDVVGSAPRSTTLQVARAIGFVGDGHPLANLKQALKPGKSKSLAEKFPKSVDLRWNLLIDHLTCSLDPKDDDVLKMFVAIGDDRGKFRTGFEFTNGVQRGVLEFLSIGLAQPTLPKRPDSWDQIENFINKDPIINKWLHAKAKRYFPKDPKQERDLVDAVRDELVLLFLNNGDNWFQRYQQAVPENRSRDIRPFVRPTYPTIMMRQYARMREVPNDENRSDDEEKLGRARAGRVETDVTQVPASPGPDPDLQLDIKNALAELPEWKRVVFNLKVEGFNYKEIADVLGESVDSYRDLANELRTSLDEYVDAQAKYPDFASELKVLAAELEAEIRDLEQQAKDMEGIDHRKVKRVIGQVKKFLWGRLGDDQP